MNISEHTLKVAVLRVRKDELTAKYEAARIQAQKTYGPHRMNGIKTVTPVLPGGVEAGTFSIKAGAVTVAFDEAKLIAFAEECEPDNVEDYLTLAAANDKRVIDMIRENFPELIGRRISPERRGEMREACEASDGYLVNTASGDRVKVADVNRADPTGEFSYIPGKKGAEAILAALRNGTVNENGEIVPQAQAVQS